ncbi:MAG: hypothetical protein ACLQPD_27060 [Desulfomonilaceae bacterium]
MQYQRIELTEWYDKEGRVRKRRLRRDGFVISPSELSMICNSLVRISDGTTKAIVASSQGNRYLPK